MTIKKGDVLKRKYDLASRKVLATADGAFLIETDEGNAWYVESEVRQMFEIPCEKWVPGEGDMYWYVNSEGNTACFYYYPTAIHDGLIKINNCFPTEEPCQAAADKFKEMPKNM